MQNITWDVTGGERDWKKFTIFRTGKIEKDRKKMIDKSFNQTTFKTHHYHNNVEEDNKYWLCDE